MESGKPFGYAPFIVGGRECWLGVIPISIWTDNQHIKGVQYVKSGCYSLTSGSGWNGKTGKTET